MPKTGRQKDERHSCPMPTDAFISQSAIPKYRAANLLHGRLIPSYRRNHARRIPPPCLSRKPRRLFPDEGPRSFKATVHIKTIQSFFYFRWYSVYFSGYAGLKLRTPIPSSRMWRFAFLKAVRIYRLVAGCRQPLNLPEGSPLDSRIVLGASLLARERQKDNEEKNHKIPVQTHRENNPGRR